MPRPRRPHVASPDEVRITRDGDNAIIEYADPKVATTFFRLGAERLAGMTDDEILEVWNQGVEATEDFIRSQEFTATEVAIGKPQVKYFKKGQQWVPRGHVLRTVIVTDGAVEPDLDEVFVSIDDRDFTVAEFVRMIGTFGGWGMRIIFVPDDEIHLEPKIKVCSAPGRTKCFRTK
jgi:hypothetical protein